MQSGNNHIPTENFRILEIIGTNCSSLLFSLKLYLSRTYSQLIIPFVIPGVTAAKGGTLTFMVGGEEEAYEQAAKLLQHMGKNVIHTGPSGTGQVR